MGRRTDNHWDKRILVWKPLGKRSRTLFQQGGATICKNWQTLDEKSGRPGSRARLERNLSTAVNRYWLMMMMTTSKKLALANFELHLSYVNDKPNLMSRIEGQEQNDYHSIQARSCQSVLSSKLQDVER